MRDKISQNPETEKYLDELIANIVRIQGEFKDSDDKDALNNEYSINFEEIEKKVAEDPSLLAYVFPKLEEAGIVEEAFEIALFTVREGKGLPEEDLRKLVEDIVKESIARIPAEWNEDTALNMLNTAFLNDRHRRIIGKAAEVPAPTNFRDIEDIKNGVKDLLRKNGIIDTAKYEKGVLHKYDLDMNRYYEEAKENGKIKDFVENFPKNHPLWEKYMIWYVNSLFEDSMTAYKGEKILGIERLKNKEAFDIFEPEVLAALSYGKLQTYRAKEMEGRTDRDKLNSFDNWNAQERAEIVKRVIESNAIKDSLAIIDVMDLPLPEAEKYKRNFYDAYMAREKEKIVKYAEFFSDIIKETGEPNEAFDYLNSRKHIEVDNIASVQIPKESEIESLSAEEVLKIVMANHNLLLQKMKKLGPKNIPFYGLSGGDKSEKFMGKAEANERVYLQFVTTLDKLDDPNLALIDLYDVVGGDKGYFAGKGHGLFVMDIEEERKERERGYWGKDGEFKNWTINLPFYDDPLDKVNELGIALSPEQIQFLRFFQDTKNKKFRPHAEKTSRSYQEGESKTEVNKRMIAHINVDDTPLYLLKKDLYIPIAASDAQNRAKRQLLTEIVYVQSVSDKIIDAFEKWAA